MKVLVINCGSSSAKFQLITTSDGEVLAKGIVDRIGLENSDFTYVSGNGSRTVETLPVPDHKVALKCVLDRLTDKDDGVLEDLSEIGAVGHRFVNGGNLFLDSVVWDEKVHEQLKKILDLAPLHNPAHLLGIEACIEQMPDIPQVIVFDTAFHSHMPPRSYMYALPYHYYEKYGYIFYAYDTWRTTFH